MRRKWLVVASVVLAATTFPSLAQAQVEPLRLGFLTVRTGALAAGGRQMEEGIQLFLKERNNTIAGRKVELFIADTGGNPAGAKTKTQELVEHDKVHVIIGPLATFEALAIDDYIKEAKVPLITPTSAAQNDLAQQKKNDFVLHAVGTAAQPMHALGEYAAKKLGYKRVATIADDFTYGHEGEAGFPARRTKTTAAKSCRSYGRRSNAIEYGTYVGQIKPNIDAVYAGFAGINGLRFLKQFNEYGLKAKIAVLGNPTCVDEGVLKNMGDEALGVVTASWYAATIDTPENKRFVQAVLDEYKVVPGFYTAGTYTAGLFLEDALKAINGKFEDSAGFRAGAAQRSPCPRTDGSDPCRRVRQADPQYLYPQGRAQGRRAGQHHRRDDSRGRPVLEIRSQGVHGQPAVFARLSGGRNLE